MTIPLTNPENGVAPGQALSWDLIEQETNAGPILGKVCTYGMDGLTVPVDVLKTEMTTLGLAQFVPDGPSPRSALRRALELMIRRARNMSTTLSETFGDRQVESDGRDLIRVINDPDSAYMVFGLVHEKQDVKALTLVHAVSLRIKIHKKSGDLFTTTTTAGDITAQNEAAAFAAILAPLYQEARRTFISRDLAHIIRSVLDWASCITVRPEGGVYFVPEDQLGYVDQLDELIDRLNRLKPGATAFFLGMGIQNTRRTRQSLAFAAQHDLLREITRLQEQIAETTAQIDKVRPETLRQRVLDVQNLSHRIAIYTDLLDDQQIAVGAQLAALQDATRAMFN
jgi:hypothetical protein